jgi:hypothetical protein
MVSFIAASKRGICPAGRAGQAGDDDGDG